MSDEEPKISYLQFQINAIRTRLDQLERLMKPQPAIALVHNPDPPTPIPREEENYVTWVQKNFIFQIATALSIPLPPLKQEIDQWTKTEASKWIEDHLDAYNKRTRRA